MSQQVNPKLSRLRAATAFRLFVPSALGSTHCVAGPAGEDGVPGVVSASLAQAAWILLGYTLGRSGEVAIEDLAQALGVTPLQAKNVADRLSELRWCAFGHEPRSRLDGWPLFETVTRVRGERRRTRAAVAFQVYDEHVVRAYYAKGEPRAEIALESLRSLRSFAGTTVAVRAWALLSVAERTPVRLTVTAGSAVAELGPAARRYAGSGLGAVRANVLRDVERDVDRLTSLHIRIETVMAEGLRKPVKYALRIYPAKPGGLPRKATRKPKATAQMSLALTDS